MTTAWIITNSAFDLVHQNEEEILARAPELSPRSGLMIALRKRGFGGSFPPSS